MKEQNNGAGANEGANNVWMIGAGMLVVGLIIGFIIGWFWQKNASEGTLGDDVNSTLDLSTSTTNVVPTLSTTYKTFEASSTVSVDDQKAGSLVFIKHVDVSSPTWIAVRETVDGAIGNILGAEMVTGATDDIPVTLLRPTKTGEKYAVFLYQDNGDGEFSFKTDSLITNNSVPVATEFTAQ